MKLSNVPHLDSNYRELGLLITRVLIDECRDYLTIETREQPGSGFTIELSTLENERAAIVTILPGLVPGRCIHWITTFSFAPSGLIEALGRALKIVAGAYPAPAGKSEEPNADPS